MSTLFPDSTGAEFSRCKQYRYKLWRVWDTTKPACLFIMLNPSTADEITNDPTVERCQIRAVAMGYGALNVCNIFALRSTDPAVLYGHQDPIGPKNDDVIIETAALADIVICGWGKHGSLHGRGEAVLRMLRERGIKPFALKINEDGTPRHPLYVSYNTRPSPF